MNDPHGTTMPHEDAITVLTEALRHELGRILRQQDQARILDDDEIDARIERLEQQNLTLKRRAHRGDFTRRSADPDRRQRSQDRSPRNPPERLGRRAVDLIRELKDIEAKVLDSEDARTAAASVVNRFSLVDVNDFLTCKPVLLPAAWERVLKLYPTISTTGNIDAIGNVAIKFFGEVPSRPSPSRNRRNFSPRWYGCPKKPGLKPRQDPAYGMGKACGVPGRGRGRLFKQDEIYIADARDKAETEAIHALAEISDLKERLLLNEELVPRLDAWNIRNIGLMRPIESMIEFKQIIGRGTRTFDGKDFFTVFDFVKAYGRFNDRQWDGEPLPPDAPSPRLSPTPGPSPEPPEPGPDDPPGGEKIVVKLGDGKERQIRYIAATTYRSHDGRLITAQEFMEQLFGDLGTLVASEDELLTVWSDPERRESFIQRLSELSYDADRMEDMRRLIDAPNSDVFDVLAYVRFALAPLARAERAEAARSAGLGGYEFEMRHFLDYVLQAYAAHGVEEVSLGRIRDFLRIRYGGTNDAKAVLGPFPRSGRPSSTYQPICSAD